MSGQIRGSQGYAGTCCAEERFLWLRATVVAGYKQYAVSHAMDGGNAGLLKAWTGDAVTERT